MHPPEEPSAAVDMFDGDVRNTNMATFHNLMTEQARGEVPITPALKALTNWRGLTCVHRSGAKSRPRGCVGTFAPVEYERLLPS